MRAVNLLPVEQRTGQSVGAGRSQGGAYAVLALVGGVALMAFLYGQAKHQVTSRRAHAAALTAQAQQAQAAAERLAPYTSFVALRDQRMQAVETLIASRFDWAHVLHEFGRVLPSDASISSLTGTIGSSATATPSVSTAAPSTATTSTSSSASAASTATPVASATPPGSVPTFTLAGCATSQTAVALTLQRLRLIDGVKEVTLQSSTAGSTNSSGSAVAGGCSGHDASFNAQVSFDPLPSASAVATAAATKTVSDPTSASTATSAAPAPTATTSGATAR
jgi:Tfp pilus assembly protein PilN